MTTKVRHTVVCATPPMSAAFGTAMLTAVPAVAYLDQTVGIRYFWELLDEAKLVIFTGGADINPAIYRQKNRHSMFNPLRDTAEIEVLRRALSMGKKVLGVCRGHQLINAWLGGELVQDIGIELNTVHGSDHALEVVDESGVIPNIYNEVNSMHHQGVIKVGEGLRATTYWKGIYESTEGDNILTVQFHPEWMYTHNTFAEITLWDYLDVWAKLDLGANI